MGATEFVAACTCNGSLLLGFGTGIAVSVCLYAYSMLQNGSKQL